MLKRWQTGWASLRNEPWALAVTAVAGLCLAWLLGQLFWWLLSGPLDALPEPVIEHVATSAVLDPQRVAGLFGEAPMLQRSGTIVDTTLQLRLDGVLENSDPQESRAFISERSSGKILSYHMGNEVPGGGKLKRINSDNVILLRNAREETLRFDKSGGLTPITPPAAAQNASAVRNAITEAADGLANSPMAALRQMGLRRTSRGYIVSITAPKEMLQRYGLQPGDRVVSINGQSVGLDLAADQQVMTQLQQAGSARVEVQRGEQTITLEQKL